jgi:hypothetical protein
MVDQRVLRDLIGSNEPTVGRLLDEHGIEISLIAINWFLTAYSNVSPMHTVVRVWDCLMVEGSVVLFKARCSAFDKNSGTRMWSDIAQSIQQWVAESMVSARGCGRTSLSPFSNGWQSP